MVGLSLGEQTFIKGGIEQDLRTGGRKRLTYRPIFLETGIIPQASGSARVKLGVTDVIASVKAELGKPNPSYPDKGKVSIYVDCSPTAEPSFEGRGGEELSTELSSALERCLLGGKVVQVLELIYHLCALFEGRSVGISTSMALLLVQMVMFWMLWELPLRLL